jgi:hypothetical protein
VPPEQQLQVVALQLGALGPARPAGVRHLDELQAVPSGPPSASPPRHRTPLATRALSSSAGQAASSASRWSASQASSPAGRPRPERWWRRGRCSGPPPARGSRRAAPAAAPSGRARRSSRRRRPPPPSP